MPDVEGSNGFEGLRPRPPPRILLGHAMI